MQVAKPVDTQEKDYHSAQHSGLQDLPGTFSLINATKHQQHNAQQPASKLPSSSHNQRRLLPGAAVPKKTVNQPNNVFQHFEQQRASQSVFNDLATAQKPTQAVQMQSLGMRNTAGLANGISKVKQPTSTFVIQGSGK